MIRKYEHQSISTCHAVGISLSLPPAQFSSVPLPQLGNPDLDVWGRALGWSHPEDQYLNRIRDCEHFYNDDDALLTVINAYFNLISTKYLWLPILWTILVINFIITLTHLWNWKRILGVNDSCQHEGLNFGKPQKGSVPFVPFCCLQLQPTLTSRNMNT